MEIVNNFFGIIRDMHEASGHKGQTKTHIKIKEYYFNISTVAVKAYIARCEKYAGISKKKKNYEQSVILRLILAKLIKLPGASGPIRLLEFI
jgi:hypothetical protein